MCSDRGSEADAISLCAQTEVVRQTPFHCVLKAEVVKQMPFHFVFSQR